MEEGGQQSEEFSSGESSMSSTDPQAGNVDEQRRRHKLTRRQISLAPKDHNDRKEQEARTPSRQTKSGEPQEQAEARGGSLDELLLTTYHNKSSENVKQDDDGDDDNEQENDDFGKDAAPSLSCPAALPLERDEPSQQSGSSASPSPQQRQQQKEKEKEKENASDRDENHMIDDSNDDGDDDAAAAIDDRVEERVIADDSKSNLAVVQQTQVRVELLEKMLASERQRSSQLDAELISLRSEPLVLRTALKVASDDLKRERDELDRRRMELEHLQCELNERASTLEGESRKIDERCAQLRGDREALDERERQALVRERLNSAHDAVMDEERRSLAREQLALARRSEQSRDQCRVLSKQHQAKMAEAMASAAARLGDATRRGNTLSKQCDELRHTLAMQEKARALANAELVEARAAIEIRNAELVELRARLVGAEPQRHASVFIPATALLGNDSNSEKGKDKAADAKATADLRRAQDVSKKKRGRDSSSRVLVMATPQTHSDSSSSLSSLPMDAAQKNLDRDDNDNDDADKQAESPATAMTDDDDVDDNVAAAVVSSAVSSGVSATVHSQTQRQSRERRPLMVMFTGFSTASKTYSLECRRKLAEIVAKLGGGVAPLNSSDYSAGYVTHLVAPKRVRTVKTVSGALDGAWVLNKQWILECERTGRFVDERPYGVRPDNSQFAARCFLATPAFWASSSDRKSVTALLNVVNSTLEPMSSQKLSSSTSSSVELIFCHDSDDSRERNRLSKRFPNARIFTWRRWMEIVQPYGPNDDKKKKSPEKRSSAKRSNSTSSSLANAKTKRSRKRVAAGVTTPSSSYAAALKRQRRNTRQSPIFDTASTVRRATPLKF
jgi:hypothetical protein